MAIPSDKKGTEQKENNSEKERIIIVGLAIAIIIACDIYLGIMHHIHKNEKIKEIQSDTTNEQTEEITKPMFNER